jgi:hypothetical protein|tara:strand:- start:367 stop:726 length:360 start_codon:yes stop_codon:yes gene_type:complete
MKYDIDSLNKKLNDINSERDILNDNLKQTIDNISDLDETNVTRELKYTMYDGLDKLYEIENDKYHDLIWKYSDSYLEMSDFYVGKNLPKEDFKKNLSDIYMFMYYVLENMNYMNDYDVD